MLYTLLLHLLHNQAKNYRRGQLLYNSYPELANGRIYPLDDLTDYKQSLQSDFGFH